MRAAFVLEETFAPGLTEARGVDAGSIAELKAALLVARRSESDRLHFASPCCAWRQRSIATATTMITPIRISCT